MINEEVDVYSSAMSPSTPDLIDAVPRRRYRLPRSIRYTCLLLVAASLLVILLPFYGASRKAVHYGRLAWRLLSPIYYNGSLDEDPSRFILPLIGREQVFDIGVSVWVRATEDEEQRHRETNGIPDDEDDEVLETILYADVPFKGLRMTDKHVNTEVSFSLPAQRL
jgi:hypothetical protein